MKNNLLAKNHNYLLLFLFCIFRYGGDALSYSYITRFYNSFGFNSIQLGIILSMLPFMAVIGNLVLSKIGTSFSKNIIIIKIWMLVEAICVMFTGFFSNYYILLIFGIAINFFNNSFYNLFDTFIIEITSKSNKTYASGRIFGTIGYIIFSFIGGILISNISYKWTFFITGCMFLIALFIFFFFKFDNCLVINQDENRPIYKSTYKDIFKNKAYVFYLLAIVILYSIILITDSTFSLYSQALNISDTNFGYFYSAAICLEAIIMFLFSKFKSVTFYKTCMYVSTISLIIRLAIFAIPNLNNYWYLSIELLRGVTFSMFLISNVNNIKNILGSKNFYKGLFVCITFVQLVNGIVILFLPTLIELFGYTNIFISLICFLCLSLVFLSCSKPRLNFLEIEAFCLESK